MRRIMMMLIVFMVLMLCSCTSEEETVTLLEEIETEEIVEEEISETIFVYVCGAVVNEGVYELPAGSRNYEAVQMAGGFTDIAARTAIDQAALLADEATLHVPNYSEIVNSDTEEDGKINLNTASKEELMTLPGVGESKADSIIAYRDENGGFDAIEEIMEISGIKEGLFEKVKDYIKI